jgi:hypothetical protein
MPQRPCIWKSPLFWTTSSMAPKDRRAPGWRAGTGPFGGLPSAECQKLEHVGGAEATCGADARPHAFDVDRHQFLETPHKGRSARTTHSGEPAGARAGHDPLIRSHASCGGILQRHNPSVLDLDEVFVALLLIIEHREARLLGGYTLERLRQLTARRWLGRQQGLIRRFGRSLPDRGPCHDRRDDMVSGQVGGLHPPVGALS